MNDLTWVSVPSSGDYQFLRWKFFHPGRMVSFRPLIRGLSISSAPDVQQGEQLQVSVPSSGDYQFLRISGDNMAKKLVVSVPSSGDYQFLLLIRFLPRRISMFPSPHPGIINFF